MYCIFQILEYLDFNRFKYKNQVELKKLYTNGSIGELVDAPDSKSSHFDGVRIINFNFTAKKYF